jgi:hypothetical protein
MCNRAEWGTRSPEVGRAEEEGAEGEGEAPPLAPDSARHLLPLGGARPVGHSEARGPWAALGSREHQEKAGCTAEA